MSARITIWLLLLISWNAMAGANSFTAEGGLLEPTHGYSTLSERWLVNDGSFEQGTCLLEPVWTCTSDNECDWIADLVPLGLWNYDGNHVGWLGGYCGGVPTEYTSICQVVALSGGCGILSWFWMAYMNGGGSRVYVTIDGNIVFEEILDGDDHLLDYQPQYADTGSYSGYHELCFHYDLNGAVGDSYFIDYVDALWFMPTSVEQLPFSVVKSLY